MVNGSQPTLREILNGYRRFNQWEELEEQRRLPRLSVEEGLSQFMELCDFVRAWQPGPEMELQLLAEERSGWVELLNRYREQRKGEHDESTPRSGR